MALDPGDGTEQEMIDFYTGMTLEEFETYVRNAYEKSVEMDEVNANSKVVMENEL